jgi:glycosyltransferase involved in cell wall biosynthesis
VSDSVLLVGNFLSHALGTRGVCEDLSLRLAGCGWNVLATSSKPAPFPRLLDMLATAWGRRGDYQVAQVDVYSGRAFLWAEAVGRALYYAGRPFVLTLHGGNLPSFARRWPGRVRRLLGLAGAVTTPSRYLLEQMCPYRPDLRLIPNPLDLSRYRFRLREQPAPRLIWLRAFHQVYNPTLALLVASRLAAAAPDVRLTMVGPDKGDNSRQQVVQLVDRLGIADRVTLRMGVAKAQVPLWLNSGDIFLNTTNIDNTPVSVIEALACGLCVVSTDVGGIPYLLEHEHDALLVPADDPEAMAAAVRRLLDQPGLAARLSQNARTKAAQFDWTVVLPQWEALLRDLSARPELR